MILAAHNQRFALPLLNRAQQKAESACRVVLEFLLVQYLWNVIMEPLALDLLLPLLVILSSMLQLEDLLIRLVVVLEMLRSLMEV